MSKHENIFREIKDQLISLDGKEITPQQINSALHCLVDNGIEEDEASTVLQALGYILLDAELFPEEQTVNEAGTSNMEPDLTISTVNSREIPPVVAAPDRKRGHWIVEDADSGEPGSYAGFVEFRCSECGLSVGIESGQYDWYYGDPIPWKACPICTALMEDPGAGGADNA